MIEPRFETRCIPLASYHALDHRASSNLLMLMRKNRLICPRFHELVKLIWISLLLTSGCIRLERISTETPASSSTLLPSPSAVDIALSSLDWGWENVNYLMVGVCFEAATDLAGRSFVFRNTNALEQFYAQVDTGHLCEDPVIRDLFSFSHGTIIAGLWSRGEGCNATHLIKNVLRDDIKHEVTIQLQFIDEGSCPYELVQPFWVAMQNMTGYDVQIEIQN